VIVAARIIAVAKEYPDPRTMDPYGGGVESIVRFWLMAPG
jgi:hypothetical protein